MSRILLDRTGQLFGRGVLVFLVTGKPFRSDPFTRWRHPGVFINADGPRTLLLFQRTR